MRVTGPSRHDRLPAASDPLLGLVLDLDLPMTKAGYLEALTFLDGPTFPLDAELKAQVPEELPGDLPTSPMDLSELAGRKERQLSVTRWGGVGDWFLRVSHP